MSFEGRDGLISTDTQGTPFAIGRDLRLSVLHWATVSRSTSRSSTSGYEYQIFDGAKPMLEFHYHPGTVVSYCHVHVQHDPPGWSDFHKVHVPTGRVAFEDVIEMLINDFGVRAKRGAQAVLDESRRKFESSLAWSGRRRS